MGDSSVSFKSIFKEVHAEPEVRRFTVDRDVSTSLAYLREKLSSIYPALRRKDFKLTWTDGDGDVVTVGTDEELIIALTEMKGPVYKFSVEAVNEKEEEPSIGNLEGEEHVGVTCDGCETSVVGFRYKCLTCPDYDLCGRCETKGLHPGHNMIRIASPQIAWPHHFYRRLHRMHDKMQKRSSSYGACPGKSEQEKQSWETAPTLFGHAYNQDQPRRSKHAQSSRPYCRDSATMGPLRQKWLEAMMKGWAGNGEEESSHQAAHESAHEAAREAAVAAHKAAHEAAVAAHKAAHEAYHIGVPCPDGEDDEGEEKAQPEAEYVRGAFNLPSPTEYLKNLGQMVACALDPLGVDVKIDVETPEGEMINISGHENREETGKAEETVEAAGEKMERRASHDDVDDATEAKDEQVLDGAAAKAAEEDLVVFGKDDAIVDALKEASNASKDDDDESSSCSSLSFVKREDAEDDEWTVVNKTPEVMQHDDEVQSSIEPGQVLYGSVHGTLYPELPPEPKSTPTTSIAIVPIAIGDPVGAVGSPVTPPAPKPTVVKDEEEEEEKTPEPEIAVHPNPRIQTALQAMLNMGFTNDGGWLTQLLEMKNGDIGRVLDVLQPVQPATRR